MAATLLLGRVFDAFGDRRWQAFFALILLGNGAYLVAELAGAGMALPGTRPIIVLILAVMVVLAVLGFDFPPPNEVLVSLERVSDWRSSS